ncbi:MAG: hypothetical protein ACREOP_05355 [Thermodesulfobacteriota bacterium]
MESGNGNADKVHPGQPGNAGTSEEGKQEGQEETREETPGSEEKAVDPRGDPAFAYDLQPELYYYEWFIHLFALVALQAKENDRRIWIKKDYFPNMAWEMMKSALKEYRASIEQLNPEFTFEEVLEYARKFLVKKHTEGTTKWGKA